jgi:PEGA domain
MEIFVHINFNKILSVLIFSCLFYKISFAQECKAKLIIKTDINNSIIKLDNKFLGSGNVQAELERGKHIINVSESLHNWDARDFNDTVLVNDCNDITLSYNFNSSIYLKTNPPDAYVYSSDSLIGSSPLFISPKFNKLSLSKPGYENKIVYLNNMPENNTIKLKYTGENNGISFYEKDIFKILVGSLVLLGGTTAYFKLKADKRYDLYQTTGEQSYLDKTRKFDLISGITMGALQINFGVLIYYFLTD